MSDASVTSMPKGKSNFFLYHSVVKFSWLYSKGHIWLCPIFILKMERKPYYIYQIIWSIYQYTFNDKYHEHVRAYILQNSLSKLNVRAKYFLHTLTAIKSIMKRHNVIELSVFNVILEDSFLLEILFPIMCKINR